MSGDPIAYIYAIVPGEMTSARDKLMSELMAIEAWDNDYCQKGVHDRGAMLAFQSRQIRRREILEQLKTQETEV
jgi:hypothetical protein